MRHLSRTHRVALDWLFDRINLDSKVQIRYIDTKHQLADILTAGNFTSDEWDNLLHVFNISHISSTCCAKNSSLISCPKKMAKRKQEQKGEERSMAKSKSTAMNLSSHGPTSSSTAKSPIASTSPGILTATGKPESRMRRNSKSDAASSIGRCIPWRVDGHSDGETCRNKRRVRGCGSFRIWNLEFSWRRSDGETGCLWNSYGETWSIQQIRKLGKSQSWKKRMATPSTHFSRYRASHGNSLLDHQTNLRTRARGPNGGPGRERGYLGHISEYNSSCSSSFWSTLWGAFTIREKSSLEVSGTVVPWNSKTDPWSNRDHWCEKDWIQRTCVEIDKLIVQQS